MNDPKDLVMKSNASTKAETRSVQITWEDPLPGARAAQGLSGLEYLRGIPDCTLVEVREGRATFVVRPSERLYDTIGMVRQVRLVTKEE